MRRPSTTGASIVPCTGAELGQSSAAQTNTGSTTPLARPRRRRPRHREAPVADRPAEQAQRVGRDRAPARSRSRSGTGGRAPTRSARPRRRPASSPTGRRAARPSSVRRPRLGHDVVAVEQRGGVAVAPRTASGVSSGGGRRSVTSAAGAVDQRRRAARRVAAVAGAGRPVEAAGDHDRSRDCIVPYPARPVARDWDDLFITGRPTLAARRARARARGAPARLLPPHAREHAQDARGAQRRGPGDAVPGRPRRGDLGAARGGADLRRRRRAHDRAGRRAARAGGRGGRPRRRRGADRAARRAAGQARPHGRRHDRPAPRPGRDPRRRRQRHRQDDEHRQARLAPAQDARPERRDRRRRHVPRRRRRAARALGRARRRRRRQGRGGIGPRRGRVRRGRPRPRARRRRRDRRHRRAACTRSAT